MTYDIKSQTATPAEVNRILAQAHALRSAYIAAIFGKATRKVSGLFRRAPRHAAAA